MKLEEVEKGWTPPDGLGYSGLRPVRLSRAGYVLVAIMSALTIGSPVLGAYLWNESRHQSAARERLDREGVAAEATIDRLWRTGGKTASDRVSYRFEAAGTSVTGSSAAPLRTWQTMHVGDTLPVRYVPADPSINHPAGWPMDVTPVWVAYVVPAIFFVEAALVYWCLSRQRHLLGEGRPTPGIVLKARRGRKAVRVHYEFRALGGAVLKGRCSSRMKEVPGAGQIVTVLYDPENPRRNAVYPFQLVRLEGRSKG